MYTKITRLITLPLFLLLLSSFTALLVQKRKPVLYIIGDSTVRNGDGTGKNQQWGWGSMIAPYFDTTRISIRNHAIGGRSSRTFITEGRWEEIRKTLQPGDYVIMQFGHNDAGALDDTARARGSIRGTGEETKDIYNPVRKMPETVHTYGWYMRNYANDAKAKGAVAIICSPVPRNNFKDGKVERADSSYGKWAAETAVTTRAFFIPLNTIIAEQYEALGPDQVNAFFPGDHTHTNEAGAILNAKSVVKGLQDLRRCHLRRYLR
ncbi:rhamnogalacturonan acetylesterase [Chitinophaga agri]|uniref:Rhamnogalacturonan acetylesterase n=1 Tax=Chitinophaga agri TaxID=2703787 RepID=A0A6B9ZA04_9BACT|nr:rhamnogalacturonan acetylesterase [Chitinophaga agri]QHS59110.1 rhamnogalacturonan acetylesterase [Chitinophaga agri]